MLFHQADEALVFRIVDALLHVGRAHVVDHHGGGQRGEESLELRQVRHFEIDHDMPAELRHPRGDPLQHVARGEIDQALDEIKPHAANAGSVHAIELVVGHLFAHEGDALGPALRRFERVHHGAVVLAVAGGLDDHVLVEAEKVAQREQLFLRRIAGRVFALRRIGEFGLRPEHVAMRIDRAGRRLELGL